MAVTREASGMDDQTPGRYREERGQLGDASLHTAMDQPLPRRGHLSQGSTACLSGGGSVAPGNTLKETYTKGISLKRMQPLSKELNMEELWPHPSSQPLTSALPGDSTFLWSDLGAILGEGACVFKQRHFGSCAGPRLLSFFSLLQSIYPSSIVIPKCH